MRLLSSGGLKCWGRNNEGQLGDNSMVDKPAPVEVSGMSSGVKAVSSGNSHTCALTDNGAVKCWGRNVEGQLGDGTNDGKVVPVDVIGMSSGVKAVSAGTDHTCAVTGDDAAHCWGSNTVGQLGIVRTVSRNQPVDVSGLSSGVIAINVGGYHTCAFLNSGVKCWGYNNAGQLGDNSKVDKLTPVDVVGLSGVREINLGAFHTCALLTTGALLCLGRHRRSGGRQKHGRPHWPVTVTGQVAGVQMVNAGMYHTCAMTCGRSALLGF